MSEPNQMTVAFDCLGDNELTTISGLLAVMRCLELTPQERKRVAEYLFTRILAEDAKKGETTT